MTVGINKAPIIDGLESVLMRVTATQNPQPLGRGECIGVIFQNSFFQADQVTANNANVYVGNSTDQIWLLIPGQESPVFYAEDLKDIYVKLLFPFPNPNGVITVAAILSGSGGAGYVTDDVLTVLSPGGTNATVQIQTNGAVTDAVLNAAGAGYTVNDILTLDLTGGAQITVDTVDGGGAILTFHISDGGTDAVVGAGVGVTGGTGAGATFDITEVTGAAFSTVVVLTGGTMFAEGGHYETTGGSGEGAIITVGTVEDTVPSTCNLCVLMYRKRKGGKQ